MAAVFFWFFSIGMLVFGLSVILNRNPVASALCFAFTIVFMAALFVMLHAFFLAAVQILVTAGAVMVLFLFIIMLLDITAAEHVAAAAGVDGLRACARARLRQPDRPHAQCHAERPAHRARGGPRSASSKTVAERMAQRHYAPPPPASRDYWDDTHQIGRLLFTTYVAPFEVTSLLILVATIGVIVLCKQDEPLRPAPREKISEEAPPLDPPRKTALTR